MSLHKHSPFKHTRSLLSSRAILWGLFLVLIVAASLLRSLSVVVPTHVYAEEPAATTTAIPNATPAHTPKPDLLTLLPPLPTSVVEPVATPTQLPIPTVSSAPTDSMLPPTELPTDTPLIPAPPIGSPSPEAPTEITTPTPVDGYAAPPSSPANDLKDSMNTNSFARLLPSHPGWKSLQDIPKFMTLPFPPDQAIALLQGWYYDSLGLHSGVDYFKWTDDKGFIGFPVLAVADGYACGEWDPTEANSPTSGGCVAGYGHRVLIQHVIQGKTYYTYYGHLETISPDIPLGNRQNTLPVKRGQFLGYAGNTGTGGSAIHLHFGVFTADWGWLDPYDIQSTHEYYPDPFRNNTLRSGINDFWTTNPPSFATHYDFTSQSFLRPGLEELWEPDFPRYDTVEAIDWEPVGAVVMPKHNTIVTDSMVVAGWAHNEEDPVNKIEIWLDGKLHCTAPYGLPSEEAGGEPYGFAWTWDTKQIPNGVHTLQIRAVSREGMRALLPIQAMQQSTRLVVNVQNPQGYIDAPLNNEQLRGNVAISGWARAGGTTIAKIEIWIDDTLHGYADYGLPREDVGGDYGFWWNWNTIREENGVHTIEVRAIAENGGKELLHYGNQVPQQQLQVQVENVRSLPLDKWCVR